MGFFNISKSILQKSEVNQVLYALKYWKIGKIAYSA